MVTRIPALQEFADRTGETFVTWEHYARMMNKAPGRYSTVLGRGHRHSHCSADWLVSTFLAGVIGDAKNSASRVPVCGDLNQGQGRLDLRAINKDGRSIKDVADAYINVENISIDVENFSEENTLFDMISNIVTLIAFDQSGVMHKFIAQGFQITIILGKSVSAEVAYLKRVDEKWQWWIVFPYEAVVSQEEAFLAPIERRVVIDLEHIKMLGELFADTLKHKPEMLLNPGSAPLTAPSLNNQEEPSTSTENEDVALSRAPCTLNPARNSTPISAGRTSKARREHGNL